MSLRPARAAWFVADLATALGNWLEDLAVVAPAHRASLVANFRLVRRGALR